MILSRGGGNRRTDLVLDMDLVSLMHRLRHLLCTLAVSLDSMSADEIESDRLQENIPLTYALERSRSRWGDGECSSYGCFINSCLLFSSLPPQRNLMNPYSEYQMSESTERKHYD